MGASCRLQVDFDAISTRVQAWNGSVNDGRPNPISPTRVFWKLSEPIRPDVVRGDLVEGVFERFLFVFALIGFGAGIQVVVAR